MQSPPDRSADSVEELQGAAEGEDCGVGVVRRQRAVDKEMLITGIEKQLGQFLPDGLHQLPGGVEITALREEWIGFPAVNLHRDTGRPGAEGPIAGDRETGLV